jgi:hypothetical protein
MLSFFNIEGFNIAGFNIAGFTIVGFHHADSRLRTSMPSQETCRRIESLKPEEYAMIRRIARAVGVTFLIAGFPGHDRQM